MTVSLTQASLSTELINIHNMIVATQYASNIDRWILIAYLIISVVVKKSMFYWLRRWIVQLCTMSEGVSYGNDMNTDAAEGPQVQ